MLRTFSKQRFFYNILSKAAREHNLQNLILMNMLFQLLLAEAILKWINM